MDYTNYSLRAVFIIPIRELNMEKRIGCQEPTTHFALPYEQTDGEGAVRLYELTGRTVFEWQKVIAYDLLARNDDGLWTHTKYGYEVPRQNGKGEILIMRELYGLAIGERILHTAHLVQTAHKAWERLCGILDMLDIPYHSIKAKGQELIDLSDGGRIEFRTRTEKGGLGESYDLLVVDEAQEYQITHESALQYVISASDNPQTIMCGTPPTPISSGTVFKDFRTTVLSGQAQDSGWAEWSVEDVSDPHDRELWYMCNPSLGLKLTERTVAAEIGTDNDKTVDFNIQRLGLWIKYNQQSVILKTDWDEILTHKLPGFIGRMCAGIKYNKNGERVSLAIAIKTDDDRIFFEVVGNHPVRDGNDWLIMFLAKTKDSVKKIVIDGAGTRQLLADELEAEKIKRVQLVTPAEVVKANAAFEKNLYNKKLLRMDQPALTRVVTNCEKRAIGSRGGFGYKEIFAEDDISLMDAVILAAWGAEEFPEPKKQHIWC